MTKEELEKFLKDNNVGWKWEDNKGIPDVLIYPLIEQFFDFSKLIRKYLREYCLYLKCKNNLVGIYMNDICLFYDIKTEEIFKEQKEKT